MHQGKELKEVADKQKNKTVFAKEIGISRDTLYKLYKKQVIPVKYVEKLRTMGIHLTKPDNTKTYNISTQRNEVGEPSEIYHLKEKIALLEKIIELQDKELQKGGKKISGGVQHNGGAR